MTCFQYPTVRPPKFVPIGTVLTGTGLAAGQWPLEAVGALKGQHFRTRKWNFGIPVSFSNGLSLGLGAMLISGSVMIEG